MLKISNWLQKLKNFLQKMINFTNIFTMRAFEATPINAYSHDMKLPRIGNANRRT